MWFLSKQTYLASAEPNSLRGQVREAIRQGLPAVLRMISGWLGREVMPLTDRSHSIGIRLAVKWQGGGEVENGMCVGAVVSSRCGALGQPSDTQRVTEERKIDLGETGSGLVCSCSLCFGAVHFRFPVCVRAVP